MRVILDTCVLIPMPIRHILLSLAEHKIFLPLWSEKIIEEWEFFLIKNNCNLVESIRVEILLMKAKWPNSLVNCDQVLEDTLFLPDKDDRHVLASAISGRAQVLLTNNLRDFPAGVLKKYGVIPKNVDSYILEEFHKNPTIVSSVIQESFQAVKGEKFKCYSKKAFLKKYGLTRLAKAICV